MAKQYISLERTLSPRPRSKRRRETAGGGSTGNITVVQTGGVSSPVPVGVDGHAHDNKSALDKLGVDGEGYVTITDWQEAEDGNLEKSTSKAKSGYADYADVARFAGSAFQANIASVARNLSEDSTDWQTIEEKISAHDRTNENKFLRKDQDDATLHSLGIGESLTVGKKTTTKELEASSAEVKDNLSVRHNAAIGGQLAADNIEANNAEVKNDLSVGGNATVSGKATSNELEAGIAVFRRLVSSPDFISGILSGKGFGIWKEHVANALGVPEEKWTGEFDNLIVRGSLRIFEIVVSQLLGENDNRIFTAALEVDHYDAATGTVYLDTQGGKFYNPFRAGDYILVQRYNGMPTDTGGDGYITKHYECVLTEAGHEGSGEQMLATVRFKNFSSADGRLPNAVIEKGDTFVRVDNESDPERKGFIQMTTVGRNTPYMDVVHSLKTDPANAMKGRMGNLSGICHHLFGQLEGFGEYLTNLYAVGDLRLRRTGESLDAKIEATRSMLSSQIQQMTYELTEGDNYLYNASFLGGMEGWQREVLAFVGGSWTWQPGGDGDVRFLTVGGLPLVVNGLPQSDSHGYARVADKDGKQVLNLKSARVRQANGLIRKPGTHRLYAESTTDEPTDGYTEARDRLFVGLRYQAATGGTLTVGFPDSGDTADDMLEVKTVAVDADGDWHTLEFSGTWNGTGDFVLAYTGEIYVSVLSITDRPLEEFRLSVGTQIVQTAQSIRLIGTRISGIDGTVNNIELAVDAANASIAAAVGRLDTHDGTLTSLGIRLDGIDDRITAEVESLSQDIGEVSGRLANYYTITQVTAELGRLKAEVNTYTDDSLSSLSTQIGIQLSSVEESVKLYAEKVSREYTDGKLAGYYTAAQVDVKADEISASVRTLVGDTETSLGSRISTVDGRITTTAEQLGTRIDEVSGQLANYYTKSQVDVTVNGINGSVTGLWGSVDGLSADLGTLRGEVTAVQADLTGLTGTTSSLRTYVTGSLRDGIISDTERVAIEKYLNTVGTIKKQLDGSHEELAGNDNLPQADKAALQASKSTLDLRYRSLVTAIEDVVSYGSSSTDHDTEEYRTAIAQKSAAVDAAFAQWQTAIDGFSQQLKSAQQSISNQLKAYADGKATELWNQATERFNTLQGNIDAANQATTNLESTMQNVFRDGVLDDAERAAVGKYTDTLALQKAELDKTYAEVLATERLPQANKTTLQNAKSTLDSAYNALTSLVAAIVGDTAGEDWGDLLASVFASYRNAVASFEVQVQQAYKAVQGAIVDYVDGKIAAVRAEAARLAQEAARAETYTSEDNPWSATWEVGHEAEHVGAVLHFIGADYSYDYADSDNNACFFEYGKTYRYIGYDGDNTWECISDIWASTSYISQERDHISSVVANFNADGSVREASGIATTAYGTKIWASKAAPSANLLTGCGNAVGWEGEADAAAWTEHVTHNRAMMTEVGPVGISFDSSLRRFTLENYFPIGVSSWDEDSYEIRLISPVMRLQKNKPYVLSFNYSNNGAGSLIVRTFCGDKETNLSEVGSLRCRLGTAPVNEAGALTVREYAAHSDGGMKRYYVILRPTKEYMRLQFVSSVASDEYEPSSWQSATPHNETEDTYTATSTWNASAGKWIVSDKESAMSLTYLQKIQLEKAVNDADADIVPSEYKWEQEVWEGMLALTYNSFRVSIEGAGLDLTKGKFSARSNNFEILNSSGKQTFAVNEAGDLFGAGNAVIGGAVYAHKVYELPLGSTNAGAFELAETELVGGSGIRYNFRGDIVVVTGTTTGKRIVIPSPCKEMEGMRLEITNLQGTNVTLACCRYSVSNGEIAENDEGNALLYFPSTSSAGPTGTHVSFDIGGLRHLTMVAAKTATNSWYWYVTDYTMK